MYNQGLKVLTMWQWLMPRTSLFTRHSATTSLLKSIFVMRAKQWLGVFVLLPCVSLQSDVIHQSVFELIHTDDRALFRRQLHFSLNPNPFSADQGGDSEWSDKSYIIKKGWETVSGHVCHKNRQILTLFISIYYVVKFAWILYTFTCIYLTGTFI